MEQNYTLFNLSIYILLGAAVLTSCNLEPKEFEQLDASHTGLDFQNQVTPTSELNILNYLYFYNGGGIGVADLNGDGLKDVVFSSNQEKNKLFINQGDFKFLDGSDRLEQKDREALKWSTGVSIADVNADGKLDIYFLEVGSYLNIYGSNKLLINQGNDDQGLPIFKDESKKYGLDIVGFGTQAAFFDYDRDNDLDLYILNHSVHSNGTFGRSKMRSEAHPLAGDRFFRNEEGKFVEATKEVGIYTSALGYGLGIGISDINNDGWPDIYIGNDFHEDDYLYLNNQDGTFREALGEMIGHTSRFSMGNDLGDINNDGKTDILSLDMLPREYEKLKTSAGEDAYQVYQDKLKYGYKDQHSRNTLQLNRGNGKFSDIGLLADVAATDWSWSGLMADFNLDGYQDIFIANGILGRSNDMDYINFISNDALQTRLDNQISDKDLELIDKMPVVKIPNYFFLNNQKLQFKNATESWGIDDKTFSNGAVYADMDNDGDLDIITNNINDPASVYRNNFIQNHPESHFLTFRFDGPKNNPFGIGAKVVLETVEGAIQVREMYPVRGYQSSLPYEVHFGLDSLKQASKVWVIWPDGKEEVLEQVSANQVITVNYAKAEIPESSAMPLNRQNPPPYFTEATKTAGLTYEHKENNFVEFHREALIPHMISAEGPAFAKGDVNQDGRDDFFIGGAKRAPSYIYIQQENGEFQPQRFEADSVYEDVDAVFADVDQDGDQDLIIVAGGNEFRGESPYLRPRLYHNNGGQWVLSETAFQNAYLNASCIRLADYDQDGDLDAFIGGRSVPWKYGETPTSYFFKNENGNFVIDQALTDEFGQQFGMVTDAAWADIDQNGKPDLSVAAEWESIKILFLGQQTATIQELDHSKGLWRSIKVADIDNDLKLDIIAGNLGQNSKLSVEEGEELKLYLYDFDQNGKKEQVVTEVRDGREFIFADKDEIMSQLPLLKKKYLKYKDFAQASLEEIFGMENLEKATKRTVTTTASTIFYQDKNKKFTAVPMPMQAQFSPMNSLLLKDFNRDGLMDIIGAGNFMHANIKRGKYDASYGEVMINWKAREVKYIEPYIHGLKLEGEVVKLEVVKIGNWPYLLAARNNAPIQVIKMERR